MKRFSLFFIISSFLFSLSSFAAVVRRIDVSGNQRMDAESVRIMSGVEIGQDINDNKLNQILKNLQGSGTFDSVDVNMSGGALKIIVKESPVISQVTIEGNSKVSLDDLKKELKTTARNPFDESTIGADVQRMLLVYQRMGLYDTKITPQKILLSGGRVNIVFEIKEGSPTYITGIKFTGNKVFSSRTLRGKMMSRTHHWWRFMTDFDVYDSDRILYDQQLLRQFYMQNGFVDFTIKSAKGVFNEVRTEYQITIDVDEGRQFKFGKITIENPFPDIKDDELKRVLTIRPKEVYNIDKLESSISAIRSKVAEYGYAFINVEAEPEKHDENLTVDLAFKIAKTTRIYLNDIQITGNVRTFDAVIEQLMNIRAGDPFSLNEIEAGRQRIMRSGYFKSANMVPSQVPQSNLMNLDVRVEEQPTGELSGGVGWSNINGFMIDAGISERNFMGRGQTVSLRGNIAQYQKQGAFSFTEPYLFDRQLQGGFDVNWTQYDYAKYGTMDYVRNTFSVGTRLGWRLTDNWSQSARLSASFDKNYEYGEWKPVNLYTLATGLRYYNLDSNFATGTHTGIVGNLSVAYTGFGISKETFMRYGADITGLFKFLKDRWQLRSTMEAGLLQPLEEDYVSRVYRYFLGGDSLRGFEVSGVGSRAIIGGYALGGMWKLNGMTQLNFPIFIPDEFKVKGFVFADYGVLGMPPKADAMAYGIFDNYIDDKWRASAGFGIFWDTPMGPMNFSWGWPILKQAYDIEQKFLLSFATQF